MVDLNIKKGNESFLKCEETDKKIGRYSKINIVNSNTDDKSDTDNTDDTDDTVVFSLCGYPRNKKQVGLQKLSKIIYKIHENIIGDMKVIIINLNPLFKENNNLELDDKLNQKNKDKIKQLHKKYNIKDIYLTWGGEGKKIPKIDILELIDTLSLNKYLVCDNDQHITGYTEKSKQPINPSRLNYDKVQRKLIEREEFLELKKNAKSSKNAKNAKNAKSSKSSKSSKNKKAINKTNN